MINEFNEFISKMNESTSSNDKIETIRFCSKNIRKVLYYTYNRFQQYYITPKLLDKRSDLCNKDTKFQNVFTLLDSLNARMITGHKAIEETNGFLYKNSNYKEMLYLVLERNLKVRASIKLINKAIPNLIPEFNVALANKYDESTKKKVDFNENVWFVSRKAEQWLHRYKLFSRSHTSTQPRYTTLD